MDKSEVVADAINAIPQWLQFLDMKEAEQQKILAEIQSQGVPAPLAGNDEAADSGTPSSEMAIPAPAPDDIIPFDEVGKEPVTAPKPAPSPQSPAPILDIDPLYWLEEDAPPPTDDAQQPGLIEATAPTSDEETELAYAFMETGEDDGLDEAEAEAAAFWDEEE